jgi:predicted O-linked N-acetylglucosamine transferase (SPINDLY family)
MAAIQPPKWETSKAKELLEKDLLSGWISLQTAKAWTAKIVYNLPDRPQFRLYAYNIFRNNLLTLRNRIKAEKKAADTTFLPLTHDRIICPLGAVNDQQGGAPHWAGSLA